MSIRYLEADKVELPSRAPQFVEEGRCQWCNEELTGRQKYYCSEKCTFSFYNYWINRPAYVRATFIRDNFTCWICKAHPLIESKPWLPDISKLEADHIIPLARGGITEMSNLQTLCKSCNRAKGTKILGEKEERIPSSLVPRNGYPAGRCPECFHTGFYIIQWQVPEGLDPRMRKIQCRRCDLVYYMAPTIKFV